MTHCSGLNLYKAWLPIVLHIFLFSADLSSNKSSISIDPRTNPYHPYPPSKEYNTGFRLLYTMLSDRLKYSGEREKPKLVRDDSNVTIIKMKVFTKCAVCQAQDSIHSESNFIIKFLKFYLLFLRNIAVASRNNDRLQSLHRMIDISYLEI